jgi:hypothetical protein
MDRQAICFRAKTGSNVNRSLVILPLVIGALIAIVAKADAKAEQGLSGRQRAGEISSPTRMGYDFGHHTHRKEAIASAIYEESRKRCL